MNKLLSFLLVSAALAASVPAAWAEWRTLTADCLNDPEACKAALRGDATERGERAWARAETPKREEPLLFTNEHLAMSRDALIARGLVEGKLPEPTPVETAAWPYGVPACEMTVAAGPAIAFRGCVEESIRAGNGLDESLRVCRAVFPE